MNRIELMRTLGPALQYWQRELPEEVSEIYYEHLRNFDVSQLSKAIFQCIQEDKYFPRIADLLPRLGARIRKESITSHWELGRNNEICDRLLLDPGYKYSEAPTYPLERIVQSARNAHAQMVKDNIEPRLAMSWVHSLIWRWNIQGFEKYGPSQADRPRAEESIDGPRMGFGRVDRALETF